MPARTGGSSSAPNLQNISAFLRHVLFSFWILEHIRNCIFHWLVILCILPPSLWWCGEVQRWWVSRFRTSPGRRERVGCARMEGSETDRQDTARGVVGVQQVCQCNMEQIQGVLMSKDLVLMS